MPTLTDYTLALLGDQTAAAVSSPHGGRKLSGADLDHFNKQHPRGVHGRFGHGGGIISGETGSQAVESGDFTGLKRVGGRLGSNPGGVYEDSHGQRWYVKAQQSEEHARNESLAGAFYAEAFYAEAYNSAAEIHTGSGAPDLGDGPQTASRWIDLDPDDPPFDQWPDKAKRAAKEQFALHAWLANWDVVGISGDNMRLNNVGWPEYVDVGGSLLYRAQGAPKGGLFGDQSSEFDTLRDPRYAPQAAAVFGTMTAAELADSAERVEAITPGRIRQLVQQHDMPPELAEKLIARQSDIVARGRQLRRDLAQADDSGQAKGLAALDAAPLQLTDKPPGNTYDDPQYVRVEFRGDDPGWSDAKKKNVGDYFRWWRNGTYRKIGEAVRTGDESASVRVQDTDEDGTPLGPLLNEPAYLHLAHMSEGFDASPLSRPVEVWRGIYNGPDVFGDAWKEDGDLTGAEWEEHSPVATSADEQVARGFSGDILMRMHVPAGTGAVQLTGPRTATAPNREAELLLQSHLRLRVIKDTKEPREYREHARILDVVVEVIPDEE